MAADSLGPIWQIQEQGETFEFRVPKDAPNAQSWMNSVVKAFGKSKMKEDDHFITFTLSGDDAFKRIVGTMKKAGLTGISTNDKKGKRFMTFRRRDG